MKNIITSEIVFPRAEEKTANTKKYKGLYANKINGDTIVRYDIWYAEL